MVADTAGHNWVNWSPDSSQIAWTRLASPGGSQEIFKSGAQTARTSVQLTTNSVREDWPAWSPDGSMMVFMSARDGNQEIYRMNADGTNQVRLTNTAAAESIRTGRRVGALSPTPRPGSATPMRVPLCSPTASARARTPSTWRPIDEPSCIAAAAELGRADHRHARTGSGVRALRDHARQSRHAGRRGRRRRSRRASRCALPCDQRGVSRGSGIGLRRHRRAHGRCCVSPTARAASAASRRRSRTSPFEVPLTCTATPSGTLGGSC